MSNIRNGNTFYIDTQYSVAADELATKGIRIVSLVMSSSSASNLCVLADSTTGTNKLRLQNINNAGNVGATQIFSFKECPISFPNGIRPVTLLNCVVTCLVMDPRG